ncbi:3D domain-containing protein [Dysosmobacter sp.]|uniref:3D domain-containing protein n=1 Tax=Dysosmobacter sp. TaxID=2591382 RepID=UPI002A969E20|nr:3D domain-containing protein [Dysosmobacter sp.]MDY5509487.1 3D domain-containing protein [Dysosmobacter sp.]
MERELTREERRQIARANMWFLIGVFALAIAITLILLLCFAPNSEEAGQLQEAPAYVVEELSLTAGDRLPGDDIAAETRCCLTDEEIEQAENELIAAALIAKANRIDNCTVTWYTEDTCGKEPGDPGYGITASGLPVVEHLTCAVDPTVIPLYADVFVQYADGTIEQLWATDTGVRGNHIDIYTPDYDYAIQCGRQTLTVWWLKEGE